MCSGILEPVEHYGPVTALRFVSGTEYLMVGYGPVVKVFNHVQGTLVSCARVFSKNKIHGIVVGGENVLFFGGRSVSVIPFAELMSAAACAKYETALNDWIIAGDFHYDNKGFVYLLTAHNVVVGVAVTGRRYEVRWATHSNEKSILYSGGFRVLSSTDILVFAGTVMSGIYVWRLPETPSTAGLCGEVVHHLTGHEGSIFGVQGSLDGSKAVSCSDDRSIKVWDLETGATIATGWGHGARIWQLEFFEDPAGQTMVLSCSEDLTLRIWQLTADGELLCRKTIEGHSGKSIWSVAVDLGSLVAATGGNDGKVCLVDLVAELGSNATELSMSFLASQSGCDTLVFAKNESIKAVVPALNGDSLLVITSYLHVFHVSDNYRSVKLVNVDDASSVGVNVDDASSVGVNHRSHFTNSFFNVTHVDSLVICTNNTGYQVVMALDSNLNINKISTFNVAALKTVSLKKITNVFAYKPNKANLGFVLLESPHPNDPYVYMEYDFESLTYTGNTKLLAKPKTPFVITAFCYNETFSALLLGSRFATVALYKLDDSTSGAVVLPVQTWRKVAPGDTVSQIRVARELRGSLLVSIALRDGIYLYVDINMAAQAGADVALGWLSKDAQAATAVWHQNKIPKGGFLEGLLQTPRQTLLYGFRSDSFYLHDQATGHELWTEPCGGSHRLWRLATADKAYRLYYVRAGALVVCERRVSTARFAREVLVDGTHGREIRDIAVLPVLLGGTASPYRIIATGAEDTTVLFSKVFESGSVKTCLSQRLHVSGLQRLKFLAGGRFLVSCAGREEFFVWKVTDFPADGSANATDFPADGSATAADSSLYVTCYDKLGAVNAVNPDLRIMDFDYIAVYSGSPTPCGYVFSLVYSNSLLKVLFYNIEQKTFVLLVEDFYKDICVLGCKLIVASTVYLSIAATDGFITVYDIPLASEFGLVSESLVLKKPLEPRSPSKLQRPVVTQQIHQNGIKDFVVFNNKTTVDIATGGDDNALALFRLHLDPKTRQIANSEIVAFIPDAASSTITSISIIAHNSILVTSLDQIVRVWSTANGLALLSKQYTTVADTGSSDVAHFDSKSLCLIGGVGLSVWKYDASV